MSGHKKSTQVTLAAVMRGFFPNAIIKNGPAAHPLHHIQRRLMSALDLINLGFYTESFITLFSLADDLTQEVIKRGMANKGLKADRQIDLLRAIKENRLMHYLCTVSVLIGWKNIEDAPGGLYEKLKKANSLRNDIMHGSRQLKRREAIRSRETLLNLIGWLATNPFGFLIPAPPRMRIADVDLVMLDPKPDNKANPPAIDGQNKPPNI